MLLKKDGKQFLREFYIYDKEIIQELKELELDVDENILRIAENIAGSASSCLSDVFILMSKYDKNKLILVEEEQGYEKYKVNEDFIEVKSHDCIIDDYSVEIFINGIPIIEFDPDFEFKDKFHKELYRNRLPSGDVQCVPFIFRKQKPLRDYAIDIPFETVRELDIHSIIDEFIILAKTIRYDEDIGLII